MKLLSLVQTPLTLVEQPQSESTITLAIGYCEWCLYQSFCCAFISIGCWSQAAQAGVGHHRGTGSDGVGS